MEYRVVAKYTTSGNYTMNLTSEWLPHRDMAEEMIDEWIPTAWEAAGEVTIERKEDIQKL